MGPATSGSRLRLARQARGFSQQQLAGMAGVSRQAVSALESGLSDPSLRVALALARVLGMTVEEVFGPGTPVPEMAARPLAPLAGGATRVRLAEIGGTLVALDVTYDFGVPTLAELIGPTLEKKVRENAEMMLAALKAEAEASTRARRVVR